MDQNEGSQQQSEGNASTTQGGGADMRSQATEAMSGLEGWLAPLFEKFPHLPEGGRKFLVDAAPWVALIFGILGILSMFGFGGVGMSALYLGGALGHMMLTPLIHLAFGLASSVMLLMAYPGLKSRVRKGWSMAFYSEVVSVAGGLFAIVMGGYSDVVGLLIGATIGFYILFEVRSYYK